MKKKTLSMLIALVLVIACAVGGTLAWLTANTQEVKNTFTVGDINITLVETDSDDTDTDANNNSYKMVPGNPIAKDPTTTVVAGSEECYLFVKVKKSANLDNYIDYAIAEGWTELQTGVYYREVSASDADQSFAVLANNTVTVKATVTKKDMEDLNVTGATQPTLDFMAAAVQKANMADVAAAYAATPDAFKNF